MSSFGSVLDDVLTFTRKVGEEARQVERELQDTDAGFLQDVREAAGDLVGITGDIEAGAQGAEEELIARRARQAVARWIEELGEIETMLLLVGLAAGAFGLVNLLRGG